MIIKIEKYQSTIWLNERAEHNIWFLYIVPWTRELDRVDVRNISTWILWIKIKEITFQPRPKHIVSIVWELSFKSDGMGWNLA